MEQRIKEVAHNMPSSQTAQNQVTNDQPYHSPWNSKPGSSITQPAPMQILSPSYFFIFFFLLILLCVFDDLSSLLS